MTNLRKFAKGQMCTLRIPGVCSGDTETTVLAHLRIAGAGGIGKKPVDMFAVHADAACHDVLDGRKPWPEIYMESDKLFLMLRALRETLERVTKEFEVK